MAHRQDVPVSGRHGDTARIGTARSDTVPDTARHSPTWSGMARSGLAWQIELRGLAKRSEGLANRSEGLGARLASALPIKVSLKLIKKLAQTQRQVGLSLRTMLAVEVATAQIFHQPRY